MSIIIVQCHAKYYSLHGKGYAQIKECETLNFPLGVYSTRDKAMQACASHAIERSKNNFMPKQSPIVHWHATGNFGHTADCTYTLFERNLDTDCLKSGGAK